MHAHPILIERPVVRTAKARGCAGCPSGSRRYFDGAALAAGIRATVATGSAKASRRRSRAPACRSTTWTMTTAVLAVRARRHVGSLPRHSSRHVAVAFVRWLDIPVGQHWLDVGCGTGALTAAVLDRAAPAEVTGVDPSDGFLASARDRVPAAIAATAQFARLCPESATAMTKQI
jgi:hypothetical protein